MHLCISTNSKTGCCDVTTSSNMSAIFLFLSVGIAITVVGGLMAAVMGVRRCMYMWSWASRIFSPQIYIRHQYKYVVFQLGAFCNGQQTALLLALTIWYETLKCVFTWWLLVLRTRLCSWLNHLNYGLDFLKLDHFCSAIAHLSGCFCRWIFF